MPTFLATAAANIALAVGASAGTALAVGAFVANYGLLLGGLALSASAQKSAKRKARDQFNAAQVDRLVNISSTVAPRDMVLGRVRKGGPVFFRGSTGANKTTFVMLVALAAHEIDAVETVYLNDTPVTLDGSGNVTTAPYSLTSTFSHTDYGGTLTYTPISGTDRYWTGSTGGPEGDLVECTSGDAWNVATYQYSSTAVYANIRAVLGTDSQAADAEMQALFPGVWTSAHRARGVAYLICRFDYSETAFPTGLPVVTALIRGAKCYDPRENLALYSEQIDNAYWTKTGTTITANATTTPAGELTADKVCETAATSPFDVYRAFSTTTGQAYTWSAYFKADERSLVLMTLCTSGLGDGAYAYFDLSAGTASTVTNAGANVGGVASMEPVGSGWYRCSISITAATTALRYPGMRVRTAANTSNYLGTAGSGLFMWGAQFAAVSTPQAYCATTSSALSPVTAWTDNPALHMRHVYQHASFGKATVTAAEDARITAAANACDTLTPFVISGGTDTQKLYRSGIVASFGAAPKDLFDDLSQAMAGSWAFAGGELYIKAGTHTASVMSLAESDLAVIVRDGASESMVPISIAVHKERAQKFNTVNVQIWDAAQSYKQVALTPLVGSALVTRDGATLTQAVTYAAIGFAPQALHVAGVMMRDARDPLVVVLPFKLRAYPLELFDTVDLTIARYGWSAKLFTVLGREFSGDGALKLTLKETASSIFALDASFSAQGGAENTSLPVPWYLDPPGALTITSGTNELVKQSDGTVVSRMRVVWPAIDDSSVTGSGTVEVQYRDVTSSSEWTSVQIQGNETQAVISAVQDAGVYTVRARARNRLAVSDWGTQVVHTVVGKTEAPPPFDTFLVLAQPDGTRQYSFGYATQAAKPIDWLGAEVRYVAGATGSPDWDTMTPLVDTATYWTNSPFELNAPLAGEWTFACKSVDTSGNKSTYLTQTITLAARRIGAVFDEYYEHTEGWLGVLTGCVVEDGALRAIDTTTWATTPATWAGWTRWNYTPTSPIYYETPERDFGAQIVGGVSSSIDADGTVVEEMATSADGVTWSAWGSAAVQFNSRWLKLRITVTATGPSPVPAVRSWGYIVTAPISSEYINDVVISALTGSYRIGTGDIRIPLVGTYTVLKKTDVTIQDSSAGTWTATRIDQTLTYGPRWQFRLNGTLTDPSFVDFYVEGY